MQFTQFTMRQRMMSPGLQRLAVVIGIGAMLGFAGPFGSYPALARPVRYAYWIGLVLAGYLAAAAVARLARSAPNIWAASLVVTLGSALPMTFVVAWVMTLVQPGRIIAPAQLPALFAAVAAVQLLIVLTLVRPGMDRTPATALRGDASPIDDPTFPTALLARLPRHLGADLLALESEDHYLRVHTRAGSELILMRLSDAVGLLDPRLGVQVHRSWWVARSAVERLEKDGQRVRLRLVNGLCVPVGRTYMAATRAGLA